MDSQNTPVKYNAKTLLLIDGAYLTAWSQSLKERTGIQIDNLKLRLLFEKMIGSRFFKAWYVNSAPTGDVQKYYDKLVVPYPKGPGFYMELYSQPEGSRRQKFVDNAIAERLNKAALAGFEHVVLVTGDGDFFTTLETLRKERMMEVWVAGFKGEIKGRDSAWQWQDGISRWLKNNSDLCIYLSDYIEELKLDRYTPEEIAAYKERLKRENTEEPCDGCNVSPVECEGQPCECQA